MWKQPAPGHEASYQSIVLYVVPPVFWSMKVEVLLVVIVGVFFFNLKLKDYSSFTTWLLHFKLIMVCIEEKKNSENYVNVLFYPVLIIFISIHSVLSKGQSKIQFF